MKKIHPDRSPELNNIELLWCALKMHLRKYRAVKNNEELLFIAKTYLDNVSCEAIQKQQDHVKKIICELAQDPRKCKCMV